jgi:electron transport complex protein RnfB
VARLAVLLGRPAAPLNPEFGEYRPPQVAVIDEETCIGCTKCIQACPVDAIAGASKLMHTVIASWCTGCELCIPPVPSIASRWRRSRHCPPPRSRANGHEARAARLARDSVERARQLEAYE